MSVSAVLGWTVLSWLLIAGVLLRLRRRLGTTQLRDAASLGGVLIGVLAVAFAALRSAGIDASGASLGAVVTALSLNVAGCAYLSHLRRRLVGPELFLAGLMSWQAIIGFLCLTERLKHPGALELRLAVLWPLALWALGTLGASVTLLRGPEGERAGLALPLKLAWRLLVAPSQSHQERSELVEGERHVARQTLATVTRIAGMGVTLGVWLVLVALGVLSGFEQDLTDKIMGSAAHLSMTAQGQEPLTDIERLAEHLKALPHVRATTPVVETEVAIASGSNYVGGVMLGVDGAEAKDVLPVLAQLDLALPLEDGDSDDDEASAARLGLDASHTHLLPSPHASADHGSTTGQPAPESRGLCDWTRVELNRCDPLCPAFLGSELARALAVDVGGTVRVISPTEVTLSPLGAVPKSLGFKVVGLVTSKLFEFDGKTLLVGRQVAARFAALPEGTASSVAVALFNPERASAVAPGMLAALAPVAHQPLAVESWQSRNQTLFAALALERIVAAIVLAFIILVAAFAVVNTLTMHIFERRWEIAILRAMGASETLVLRTFVFQGLFIGSLGTLAGAGLGLATLWGLGRFRFGIPDEVYYIDALPVQMALGDVVWVVLAGLLIVWDFAVWPSMRAASVRPAWGLRDS